MEEKNLQNSRLFATQPEIIYKTNKNEKREIK